MKDFKVIGWKFLGQQVGEVTVKARTYREAAEKGALEGRFQFNRVTVEGPKARKTFNLN